HRNSAAAANLVHEGGLELPQKLLVIAVGDFAARLVRELLSGELVLLNSYELGAHAELLQEAPEVPVLGRQTGVAQAARRIHRDAVGLRAEGQRAAAGVFELTEHLLAAQAKEPYRFAELLGVRERVCGLGVQYEDETGKLGVVGHVPEPFEQMDVP